MTVAPLRKRTLTKCLALRPTLQREHKEAVGVSALVILAMEATVSNLML